MTSTETRPEPPGVAGEREQLAGFLDFLRSAVVMKAEGLTDEQARRALVPSELTTVAGLVAHLTYVEQYWFGVLFAGRPDEWRDRFAEDPDAEFTAGMRTPLADLIANYTAECARSRAVASELDLDATATHKGEPVNFRWALIHMIEETGRHAGHLDLLRELLDGSTGE
ncbi:DinB family protein [Actinophytocola algeriensis]|uniref:Putative damage-inducible protein DinB n=1 Tax=Actinophytocola algeriensis TaxID=1768010 RepID=A0A7W7VHE8_9PSEU|nr:DinB family protein [Actinophytocola algeriensis]MBB4910333.1 putative damage-inducible protein DinB [Actinophytocola algeriensis]MBE1480678.1 putative damage-inducible protein DinB [Actinophytocola algeriensis]